MLAGWGHRHRWLTPHLRCSLDSPCLTCFPITRGYGPLTARDYTDLPRPPQGGAPIYLDSTAPPATSKRLKDVSLVEASPIAPLPPSSRGVQNPFQLFCRLRLRTTAPTFQPYTIPHSLLPSTNPPSTIPHQLLPPASSGSDACPNPVVFSMIE